METSVYFSRKGKLEVEGLLNRRIRILDPVEKENKFQIELYSR